MRGIPKVLWELRAQGFGRLHRGGGVSAGSGQLGGWKREGRAFQAEVSVCKDRSMKAKPETRCRAGAEGRQEEKLDREPRPEFAGP